ncbi:MAG: tripartite tricarboxylate transporter substrate-binding protein, partial [Burkholderiales bacterium]
NLNFSSIAPVLGHIKAGRLQALTISGIKRSPQLPDVPTVSETVAPGFEFTSWFGLLAPARASRAIIGVLRNALLSVLQSPETRSAFAQKWSDALGVKIVTKDSVEEVVRGADIILGGTTSGEIVSREPWLKPGATFISLARRELDPAGWSKMDKVVIDSWEFNMLQKDFRNTVTTGLFSREQLHAEIQELVAGTKKGRERDDERILIHTTGLVSQDVALAHFLYEQALAKGLGMWLPAATGAKP